MFSVVDLFVNFNSHAHVERDVKIMCDLYATIDFNSHAHVERDEGSISDTVLQGISTHTLTWSVT